MSDSSDQPAKPLSPLERVKARQAEQASNRAAKNKTPDPTDAGKGGGTQGTSKPMRSSANKSGG
ncbi:hypothetical protein EON83_02220 [bacterium]|nr:MAG: hypothetical protein EON83_02220 [bacterium]